MRNSEHGFRFVRRSAEHGFTFVKRSAEHGFTLIEIMVALAVFSLAVLALVRLEGATTRGVGTIDETIVAQLVARNVALDAFTDTAPPVTGLSSGSEANGGRSWNWTRRVTDIGSAGIVRIDVAVRNLAGQTVGQIVMIRPPAAPAVPLPQPAPSASASPRAGGPP